MFTQFTKWEIELEKSGIVNLFVCVGRVVLRGSVHFNTNKVFAKKNRGGGLHQSLNCRFLMVDVLDVEHFLKLKWLMWTFSYKKQRICQTQVYAYTNVHITNMRTQTYAYTNVRTYYKYAYTNICLHKHMLTQTYAYTNAHITNVI